MIYPMFNLCVDNMVIILPDIGFGGGVVVQRQAARLALHHNDDVTGREA